MQLPVAASSARPARAGSPRCRLARASWLASPRGRGQRWHCVARAGWRRHLDASGAGKRVRADRARQASHGCWRALWRKRVVGMLLAHAALPRAAAAWLSDKYFVCPLGGGS